MNSNIVTLNNSYIRRRDYFILLIGEPEDINLLSSLLKNKLEEFGVIGIITTNSYSKENLYGIKNLGSIDKLEKILKEEIIDEILLFQSSLYQIKEKVINKLIMTGRKVTEIKNNYKEKDKSKHLELEKNFQVNTYCHINENPTQKVIKRVFDIFFSMIILTLALPLLMVLMFLVKMESPKDPIFYKQERVGINGRRFHVIKYRTMINGADKLKDKLKDLNEMDGPVFKIANDPRITRIGKFLRKTSLDELPQFINVLKGEMSVVGPRPLPTKEAISCDLEHQIRHSIKPGITCIWQINGRNDITYSQWKGMDLDYVKKRNFLIDLMIILKTFLAVVKMTGK